MRLITLNIAIQTWCAWQLEVSGTARLLSFVDGEFTVAEMDKPVVENVPPMQKRRLSPLARVVFQVLDVCTKSDQQTPVIFSSVMGEIKRTQGILEAMASDQAVSPASFSLSVHNSVGGLWSLVRNNKAPMIALAPTGGSPVAALIEAAGMLAEGKYDAVTVVLYDEDYPSFYDPFLKGPEAPYAVAMRLVAPGAGIAAKVIQLDISPVSGKGALAGEGGDQGFIDVLAGKRDGVVIAEPQCNWSVERC